VSPLDSLDVNRMNASDELFIFLFEISFLFIQFLHFHIPAFHPLLIFRGVFAFIHFTGLFAKFSFTSLLKTCGDLYGVAPSTTPSDQFKPSILLLIPIVYFLYILYQIYSYPEAFILSTSRESRGLTVLETSLYPLVLLFKICIQG